MSCVRVSRSRITTYGLLGEEKWWDVSLTGPIFGGRFAMTRNWNDAMVIAQLAASKVKEQP